MAFDGIEVTSSSSSKEVLENLVYLDEVYKRIRANEYTEEDLAFSRELQDRLHSYERKTGSSLEVLIGMAKRGEFCPYLAKLIGRRS